MLRHNPSFFPLAFELLFDVFFLKSQEAFSIYRRHTVDFYALFENSVDNS